MEDYLIDIYVLHLEDDYYYVGKTKNVKRRFSEHISGKGAEWTKLHKPLGREERHSFYVNNEYDENKHEDSLTIEIMNRHGWQRVRGGRWCHVSDSDTLRALHRDGYFKDIKLQDVDISPMTVTRFMVKLVGGGYYVGYTRNFNRTKRKWERGDAPKQVRERGIKEWVCQEIVTI